MRGYLLKDAPSATLAQAIRIVDSGGKSIDPGLAMKAWREDAPLTDREQQVLRPTSKGRTSAEIATQINLSDGTGN